MSDTDDPYKIIETGVLGPTLTEVRLYDSTIAHAQKHEPEFPTDIEAIVAAVERGIISPTHVETSYKGSLVFVDAKTTNFSGDPLIIPVQPIPNTTSGRVKTFYFAKSDDTSPDVIWRGQG